MSILTASLIIMFNLLIIMFEIWMISVIMVKYTRMKKENDEWKTNIENLYESEIKELVNSSREILECYKLTKKIK